MYLTNILNISDSHLISQIKQKHLREKIFKRIFKYSLLFTILILSVIALYIIFNGIKLFQNVNILEFLTTFDWEPVNLKKFGIFPMILTSLLVTIGSVLLSTPLAIGCALFTAETKNKVLKDIIQSAVAVLAGIPSVVYGLIGLSVLIPWIQTLGNAAGYSILAGILVLTVMILPTILSISQDAIESVPKELKEGSIALGGTQWQTVYKIILPMARSGIIAAIVLGISRAFGEAMAIKMVIGNIQTLPEFSANSWYGLLSPARTLTTNIIGDIDYAQPGAHLQALFATGIILFIVTMLVNVCAYFFINQSKSKLKRRK